MPLIPIQVIAHAKSGCTHFEYAAHRTMGRQRMPLWIGINTDSGYGQQSSKQEDEEQNFSYVFLLPRTTTTRHVYFEHDEPPYFMTVGGVDKFHGDEGGDGDRVKLESQ
jgi:hypothetical protein